MLFSNALLFATASAIVSAAIEVELPQGWAAVEKREEAPRLNKLFARLAKRRPNALDTTKIPPGVTYVYSDASTTVTIVGKTTTTTSSTKASSSSAAPVSSSTSASSSAPVPTTTITAAPSATSTTEGSFQTTTEVIASSCDEFGDCITTTFMVGINTD